MKDYFPQFEVPPEFASSPVWIERLERCWNMKYRELYEEPAGPPVVKLAEACSTIVRGLWDNGGPEGHRRVVWMCLAMAHASRPLARHCDPTDQRPDQVISIVEGWLLGRGDTAVFEPDFSDVGIKGRSQELDESLLVFQALLRALKPEQALESALEVLDCCFEGYAILPGLGKRDLFNWWLLRVVPSAFECRVPSLIYTKDLRRDG